MLEPHQASMIGQKIAESETARELMARIKQVTRRRRLTVPPVTGPGARLDPNEIAEYLDNVLSAGKLAEVEETCLASDVHLAEVAACHQILTLVLGEPALIPPTAHMRMYRLVDGPEALPDRKVPAAPLGRGSVPDLKLAADESDEALLLGLPVYERSHKWLRWLVPFIAACLLLAAGIAIGMALLSGPPGLVQFKGLFAGGDHPARQTDQEVESTSRSAKDAGEKVKTSDAATGKETRLPPKDVSEKAKQPAETATKSKANEKGPVPESKTPPESAKKVEPPKVPATEVQPPVVQKESPSGDRRELGKTYWAGTPASVLLSRTADTGSWQRVGLQKRISSTEYLVGLPGYRTEIRLDSGLVLQLWGNLPQYSRLPLLESAVTLHSDPMMDLDFTLDHGRVVILDRKDKTPAHVRLRFRKEVCDLKLLDRNTEVAVDMLGICPPYSPEPRVEPVTQVRVYALRGQIQVRTSAGEHLMRSMSTYDWDSRFGYAAQPVPIPSPPDWFTPRPPMQTPAARELQTALDTLSKRIPAKERVEIVLTEAIKDADANSRDLAVRFLGAMGEIAKLLDCLADERHVDVRNMAIDELRHLLALSAQNDERILTLLKQKNYSDRQIQIVLQLLHGIPPEQWSPAMRSTMVENLNNEKLAIRQIAHTLLLTFVPDGKKIRYDAAGSPDQRERGFVEWQRLIGSGKAPAKPDRSK
jgi:hypothetical protein